VLVDGVAHRTPIETGARSLSAVEVLAGLRAGDVIVTSSIEAFESAATVLVTN
jgi:HlyD family secretion protein